MSIRFAVFVAMLSFCAASFGPVQASETEKEGKAPPSGEIRAKLAPAYVAEPALHMAVQVDANAK